MVRTTFDKREITKTMVEEFSLSQREVARKLGLTEAAISQYINRKRGRFMELGEEICDEVVKSVRKIVKVNDPIVSMVEMCRICRLIRKSGMVCDLHVKKGDALIGCDVCMK